MKNARLIIICVTAMALAGMFFATLEITMTSDIKANLAQEKACVESGGSWLPHAGAWSADLCINGTRR